MNTFAAIPTFLLVIPPLCAGPAWADDLPSHIDCDNSAWVIPDGGPVRLDEASGWIRPEKNLLTNFYSMYHPEVIYVPERDKDGHYPYLMWFFGWSHTSENDASGAYPGYPGGDAIFHARAKDLEGPWEIYSLDYTTNEFYWDTEMNPVHWYPVLTADDKWYDSWHVGDGSVVYQDGTFFMAYSSMGCDSDGIPAHKSGDIDGNASCVMGATSTDGIHWQRTAKPLVIWSGEKGWNESADGGNYLGGHQRPSLMFEDGVWKMWFDYRGNQIGYAECDGGFTDGAWKESHTQKRGMKVSVDFDVVKIGDIYYAYGDPYVEWEHIEDEDIPSDSSDPSRWSRRQIVEYQSRNGKDWTATGYFLPDAGYDANQVPQVFLDHKRNRLCIFYATQRGKRHSGWGGAYDWRWDTIRMMYRNLELFSAPSMNSSPTSEPTPTPEANSSLQGPHAAPAARGTCCGPRAAAGSAPQALSPAGRGCAETVRQARGGRPQALCRAPRGRPEALCETGRGRGQALHAASRGGPQALFQTVRQ